MYDLKEDFLDVIDTERKAYILGIIAADGSASEAAISIGLRSSDKQVLLVIRSILYGENSPDLRTKKATDTTEEQSILSISNREMSYKVRQLLNCGTDKSDNVSMPELETSLYPSFLRGYFDGDGSIRSAVRGKVSPECNIASNSMSMLKSIHDLSNSWGFSSTLDLKNKQVRWSGLNSLDFLGKIYSNSSIHMNRKYDLFLDWCLWQPVLKTRPGYVDGIKVWRTREEAVLPSKSVISDSGYDVTLTHVIKEHSNLTFYGTGLRVQPPDGYYLDMIARSSLQKKGYMMANAVGVIDRGYRGELIVGLFKFDTKAKRLALPCRAVQLIPRQIVHFTLKEVNELSDTKRGEGGFGSTGK